MMFRRKRISRLLTHLAIITSYIIYERVLVFMAVGKFKPVTLIYYIVEIPFLYFVSYFIIPLLGKNWMALLKSVGLILSTLIVFVMLQYAVGLFVIWYDTGDFDFSLTLKGVFRALTRGIYFLWMAFAYYLGRLGYYKEHKAKEILAKNYKELSRVMALEHNYLRAQVPTHLIFNSMDFIYNQIEEASPEGAERIDLLAKIFRYALSSADENGLVPVKAEMDQVNNYVKLAGLQKQKYQYLKVEIDLSDAEPGLVMPPVMLVSMIENLLKHGRLDDPNHPAVFRVDCKERLLTVTSHNLVAPHPARTSYGIGLKSMVLRMERQYAGRYSLETSKIENVFHLNFYVEL